MYEILLLLSLFLGVAAIITWHGNRVHNRTLVELKKLQARLMPKIRTRIISTAIFGMGINWTHADFYVLKDRIFYANVGKKFMKFSFVQLNAENCSASRLAGVAQMGSILSIEPDGENLLIIARVSFSKQRLLLKGLSETEKVTLLSVGKSGETGLQ